MRSLLRCFLLAPFVLTLMADQAAGLPRYSSKTGAKCQSCHVNGVYRGTPRDCAGCHLTDYQQSKEPNHATSGFSNACETRHRATDTSWYQGRFDHAAVFQLVGVHATQQCQSCHANGLYRGTPRDCIGCHLADFKQTAEPNHAPIRW